MKKILITLIWLFSITTTALCDRNTFTVTSCADSGVGTLRNAFNTVSSGDSIVIAGDIGEIVLDSTITVAGKNVALNGQGGTVRVTEPGVSRFRTLNVSYPEGTSGSIALYNLTLKGGDISADVTSTDNEKGGVLFLTRGSLLLKNCRFLNGKANIGGALADGAGSVSLMMDGCTFSENVSTKGSAACVLGFSHGITITDCLFDRNNAIVNGGCSAIDIVQTAVVRNCRFTNNHSNTGRSGAALSVRKTTGNVTVENCVFTGNINGNNDGGSAVTKQVDTGVDKGGLVKLINCTFYDNRGGRGAVYIYQGEAIVVNCTFTGNKNGSSDTKYPGGFYAAQDKQTIVRLANNIMVYNYCMNSTAKDYYVPSSAYCTQYGENNLIAIGDHIASTILIDKTFNYATSSVFTSYFSNNSGDKVPLFDEKTGTVPLASNSIAIGAGVSSYSNPNLIPRSDLRGVPHAIPPCIGSYEYEASSGMNEVLQIEFKYRSADNILTIISDKDQAAQLFGIEGRLVAYLQLNRGENTFSGLTKGVYLLNNTKIVIR